MYLYTRRNTRGCVPVWSASEKDTRGEWKQRREIGGGAVVAQDSLEKKMTGACTIEVEEEKSRKQQSLGEDNDEERNRERGRNSETYSR